MDNTLRAILSELMSVSIELDQCRKRVAELEQAGQQQLADVQARLVELQHETIKDS